MSLAFSLLTLALVGASLILITLSLRFLRATATPADSTNPAARFFLIALRVAIGWHCFVEGMEKVATPAWSSETYLRESMGPCAGLFRWVAGDRLIEKLDTGADDAFPPALEREWRDYLNAFAAYYELDAEQLQRAQGIFDQRKSDTLTYLRSRAETVTKISAFPPDLTKEMTIKERLEEHERLLQRVRALEAKFPTTDKDVHADWKKAKADLAKWRGELKKSIDAQTNKLKTIDDALKTKLKKKIDELSTKLRETSDAKEKDRLQKELDAESAKLWSPLGDVLTSEQRLKGPMPEPAKPISSWRLLESSDFAVKWSLVVLGACLMLGLLSRATSLATALLIFSFYLAMPALPGWPEGPRLEGHYLLVNKTLIEVIALLALTCIPTGRWAGLDGLRNLCCPCSAKAPTPPPMTEKLPPTP